MNMESKIKIQDAEVNPITRLDYPDPDVIRVGDIYYMVSTTMHFMPGGEILRSYDLVNWEHAAFVYDRLDSTPGGWRADKTCTARACGRRPCAITRISFMSALSQTIRVRPICTRQARSRDRGKSIRSRAFTTTVPSCLTGTTCTSHTGARISISHSSMPD